MDSAQTAVNKFSDGPESEYGNVDQGIVPVEILAYSAVLIFFVESGKFFYFISLILLKKFYANMHLLFRIVKEGLRKDC
jgi:hypothetical protein